MHKPTTIIIAACALLVTSACGSGSDEQGDSAEDGNGTASGESGPPDDGTGSFSVDGKTVALKHLQCTGPEIAGPGISRMVASAKATTTPNELMTVTAFDASVFDDAVSSRNAVVYQKNDGESAISWRSDAGVTIEDNPGSGIVAKGKVRMFELKKQGSIWIDSGKAASEPKEFTAMVKCEN